MTRVFAWISLAFLLLALSLGALIGGYWYVVLQPRLYQEAEAHAGMLAQAQASRLAEALAAADQRPLREAVDEILTLADAQTGIPFFPRVAIEADYDLVPAPAGDLDLLDGEPDCRGCFLAEVPLFDPGSYALLGVARLWVSDRFFRQLSGELKRNLLHQSELGLILLALVWISVLALVYQLHRQSSQRQRAEQALRQNQERYRRLLDNLSGYFVYSRAPNGTLSFVSDSVRRVLGYDPEAFRRRFQDMLLAHQPGRSDVAPAEPGPYLIALRDHRGQARHLECTETRLPGGSPAGRGVEGIARDVTEQRAIEDALRLAKERAEAANRAKSEFLANVSHEVRTPMNAIMGLTALALKTDLNAKQTDYLGKIQSSAQALLDIINDILDISKMEAGSMVLEDVELELDQVLQQLADLVSLKAEEKGLELVFARDPAVPGRLKGDPLRLGQVLLNLTNNAIKFTSAGEILVCVDLVAEDEHWVRLAFSVQDTGIGIDPEEIPRLFEPFTQADGSNTRLYGGTGLGLTICKRLVALMDGEIHVETRPGEGSTFRFTARFERPAQRPDALRLEPGCGARARALVADDSEMAQDVICHALAGFGLEVAAAGSGAQALQRLEQADAERRPFCLLLLDWKMPDGDGLETAQRIRAHPRLGRQPAIILMSASAQGPPRESLAELGLDAFVAKPISPSVLFDAVQGALGHQTERPLAVPDSTEEIPVLAPGSRVLLVEDNVINQEIALEMLRGAGLQAEVAGDGEAALHRLEQGGFAAVLMDLQMPVLDGYAATRRLRADPRFAELPVIALTARAMAGDAERCLAAGMSDYLSKPLEERRLLRVLGRWLPTLDRAAAQTGPTPVSQLPPLPGIDRGEALRLASGNPDLARRLLRRFGAEHREGIDPILTALRQDGRAEAAALIHTLKGTAGGIGAKAVSRLARELEQCLEDGADCAEALDRLGRHLKAVVGGIAHGLDAADQAAKARAGDQAVAPTADLAGSMRRLAGFLRENNFEAIECFRALSASIAAAGQADGLEPIAEALDQLDFVRAEQALRRLAEAHGIALQECPEPGST